MSQTQRRVYGKLIRDRIPEIIEAEGDTPVHRTLGDADFVNALVDKVGEEVAELRAAGPDEQLEELADVYEVVTTLTSALGFTQHQLESAAARKRAARGGFSEKLWLDEVLVHAHED